VGVEEVNHLQEKLSQALILIKEAVDIMAFQDLTDTERKQVSQAWEKFVGAIWNYIKFQSRKSQKNLLSGISFQRIKSWS
jgi:cytoplasmic iron level regulating protein YaaA (DUF328/UPF0246 family)